MKIALFGATGRVGQYVLKKALDEGHSVTALVRSPEKLAEHERLTLIQGDVRNRADVEKTLTGMEVVLSALGTDKTTTLTEAIQHMIYVMKEMKMKRIVTVGTAGILDSRIEPGKLRYEEKDTFRRSTFAVEEHRKMYELLNESGLDWTVVCPTYLPDGDAEGSYRVERDYLPEGGKRITVGDTADFLFDELVARDYVGSRVSIAY